MQVARKTSVIHCASIDQLTNGSIYTFLRPLEKEYPNFRDWYLDAVIPGVQDGTRNVYVAYFNDEIVGILIIKDTIEKKICTLRVAPECRRMGIGTQLMSKAISVLHTTKPLITVSDEHIGEFMPLLNRFDFSLRSMYVDYYRPGHTELAFNGFL